MKESSSTLAKLGVAGVSFLLAGCGVIPKFEQAFSWPGDDETPEAASAPSVESAPALPEAARPARPQRLVYYQGVEGSLTKSDASDPSLEAQTMTLDFVNAPAGDVARAVIGEILGDTVAVAGGVSGAITLSAVEPVSAGEALRALEAVLAESGLALLKIDAGYLLTRLDEVSAEDARLADRGAPIGYGVAFMPIRHATPSQLVELIRPFVSERLTITADDPRSAIVLRGPQVDIANARDAIETFDAPSLVDRTFGLFELQYVSAAAIKAELQSILAAEAPASRPAAEVLDLPRLNMLFVTASTQQGFNGARQWIERLDQPSGGDERRLRYYQAQNTPADVLADQLNAAFGGGGAAFAPSEEASSAVQPTFRRGGEAESGGALISTDVINNALIIRATDREYREILDLVQKMDVLAPQVLIEATIAEVTLTDELNFGVRWFFQNAESTAVLSDNEAGTIGRVFPGFNYSYFETDARVALDTLASVTDVSVLSAPSIMVLNNQSANLRIGDEVPIVTQQAQSVIDDNSPLVSTIQLRETGVILEVKPRINASDVVVLEITQEVSDVAQTTSSGIDSPTIQQRKFTSTVAVRDGGTVALGGLIREVVTDNESGIPILKDIPGLGYVFKSRDVTKRRTELIVFLSPRIVRSDSDAKDAIKYIRREMTRLGVNKRS